MIALNIRQRTSARPIRRENPTHLFTVGQQVRLKGGYGRPALLAEIYQVTATLPPRGDSPQYRIRNDGERHERVTTQDNLELIGTLVPDDGATLMERTFGHGQGTAAQQSGDQKAEAEKGAA